MEEPSTPRRISVFPLAHIGAVELFAKDFVQSPFSRSTALHFVSMELKLRLTLAKPLSIHRFLSNLPLPQDGLDENNM